MNLLRGCVVKAWDILFPVSIFYFVAVSLDNTQARVLPFVWSQTNIHDSNANTDVFNRVGGNKGDAQKFGYIQFVPNGTLILRSTMNNGTNLQNLLLFKSVLGAMKIYPQLGVANSKWNIKIYGEGIEHKFPPFLERIIQRIQTYFSVYKYTDTSALENPAVSIENTNLQDSNIVTAATCAPSVNRLEEVENNRTGSIFSGDESDLEQSLTILGVEPTTNEENDDEYTEFIAISDHDDDFIVVGED
ncbi:uncharacterized protein LOC129240556 [Anastrepha obliqua]|uniref:uncharacterized protein LOC129240556 n=1 Tax=Anastrepha obliqua TaxID=95512 RepID=UPI00240A27AD|nr:uncharacterized protein LOC129240556 [Anastrepha obliqua]